MKAPRRPAGRVYSKDDNDSKFRGGTHRHPVADPLGGGAEAPLQSATTEIQGFASAGLKKA